MDKSSIIEFFAKSELLFDDNGMDLMAFVEGLGLFGCREVYFVGASVAPNSPKDTYLFRLDGHTYRFEVNWLKGEVDVL